MDAAVRGWIFHGVLCHTRVFRARFICYSVKVERPSRTFDYIVGCS